MVGKTGSRTYHTPDTCNAPLYMSCSIILTTANVNDQIGGAESKNHHVWTKEYATSIFASGEGSVGSRISSQSIS